MEFNSSTTSITVLDECTGDFMRYMAEKIPDMKRHYKNRNLLVSIAVECAIRDHAEWFEISFFRFKRKDKFYGKDPEFWIRERVTQGLTRMEMIL